MSMIKDLEIDTTSNSDEEIIIEDNTDKLVLNPFFSKKRFFIKNEFKFNYELSLNDIKYTFNELYVLCLKNKQIINDKIYQNNISINEIKEFSDKLILIKVPFDILKNKFHKSNIVLVDYNYIHMFNDYNYNLSDCELLLPFFNIEEKNLNLYLKQYTGLFTIKDYCKLKLLNNYYKDTNYISLTKILDNIDDNTYWTKKYNCNLNLNFKFYKRDFNLNKIPNIKKIN